MKITILNASPQPGALDPISPNSNRPSKRADTASANSTCAT
jgi:hypothetical protein